MSKLCKSLALTLLLSLGAFIPVYADQKDDLVQIIRQDENPRAAMEVTKLMTFNLTPKWWEYFLDRSTNAHHMVRNMADSQCTYAHNYGADDVTTADNTGDGSNPLVASAIDSVAAKTHCTFDLMVDVKDSFKPRLIDNIALISNCITEKYYCKPRGGKCMLTITLDAAGKALRCDISKDGNNYHFFVPAYADFSSSPIEEALKRGT